MTVPPNAESKWHWTMLSFIAFLLWYELGRAQLHSFSCLCLCHVSQLCRVLFFCFATDHCWCLYSYRDPALRKDANRRTTLWSWTANAAWANVSGAMFQASCYWLKLFEHVSIERWGTYQVWNSRAMHCTGLQWLNCDECFNVGQMRQCVWHLTFLARYTQSHFHVDIF